MEVGMSVDEYAQMIFTMVCCFAVIGLIMALVVDEDDNNAYPRRTEGIFRDRLARRRRQVVLEEETVEN